MFVFLAKSIVSKARLILAIALLAWPSITFGQENPKQPSILVIHSWHDILWDRLWEKGLNDKLAAKYRLVRFDLDAMRVSSKQLLLNADKAWDIYTELKPSLVILGDDAALKMMGMRFADTLPVVYLGINNNPRNLIGSIVPSNITGVMERPLYERALRHIVKLLPPNSDKILFLNDSQQTGASVTNISDIFRGKSNTKVGNVTIELVVTNVWETWQQAVMNAKSSGYDAILFDSRYLLFNTKGTYVEPETGVIRWMAKHSELPMFNFYEDSIGPQLSAGGWVLSGYGIGSTAANIVLDILENGKQPKDIYPVDYKKGEYIFSRVQLKRWGIELPSEIKNTATFAEDMHQLYNFDCNNYPESICF